MINIGLDPILLTWGPFSISWHSLFIAVAIAVGVWIPVRLTAKAGLSRDAIYSLALWGVPGGIIGARVVHIIDYWGYYSANPGSIFAFWQGGLAIWGAILGGVLGSQVGKGDGRTAAIILGTMVGAMIGGNVGKSMDETDQLKTADSLETVRTGEPTSWNNPDTGNEYTVTPTRTYEQSSGPCREYTIDAKIDGKNEKVHGTACRQPDGSWQNQS